ncbi:hypothetical protein RhiirA4_451593 [Rhizophagus irregularis]|uniref:Uncharacterized protein n=1 Tax=Rhizophagus irregularis TaxID=588596 RepID=A0A2I1FW56_9GLOM|nr:hypothetical protein RhiirA4_451593 [Rhizophagus irregularis]
MVTEAEIPISTAWNRSCSFLCLRFQLAENYCTGIPSSGAVQALLFYRSNAALLRFTDMAMTPID